MTSCSKKADFTAVFITVSLPRCDMDEKTAIIILAAAAVIAGAIASPTPVLGIAVLVQVWL